MPTIPQKKETKGVLTAYTPDHELKNLGLTEKEGKAITHSDGHTSISKTTKVTGKGQQYFINYFLQVRGMVAA